MNLISVKMFSSNIDLEEIDEEQKEIYKELKRFLENYVIVLDKQINKEGDKNMNQELIFKLETERDELEQKVNKLAAFLNDKERLAAVSQEQNELLHEQYLYMHRYLVVLNKRISNLVEEL